MGLFIDSLFQALLGEEAEFGKLMFARIVGWGIFGLFVAVAPGIVLRNPKRFVIGMAGGLLGGIAGGALFDPISFVIPNAMISRFIAICAIGLVAGIGTGLIENVAKTGWLRVVGGVIAGKQFVVYKNPTYLGSSPQCEIYLFKDTQINPQHAALHTVPGGYELEDLRSQSGTFVNGQVISRTRLRNNDQIQVGSSTFVFQEKQRR